MKSNTVKLAEWTSNEEQLDIDWPRLQRDLGKEHVEWLLRRPKTECQLVVEKNGEFHALIAEFYNEQVQVDYWLRWAR